MNNNKPLDSLSKSDDFTFPDFFANTLMPRLIAPKKFGFFWQVGCPKATFIVSNIALDRV